MLLKAEEIYAHVNFIKMNARKKSIYLYSVVLVLLIFISISATNKPDVTEKKSISNEETYATPESVEYYAAEDVYLVTNINGSPLALDGNGFISKVSPNGDIIELKWIDGATDGVTLNGPKGMTIVGDNLFVADINRVHIFELPSGKQKTSVFIEGSTFINGIDRVSDTDVVVTDSGFTDGFTASDTDAIYKVSANGKYEKILGDKAMGHPNGIVANGDKLTIVTFGSGEIFSIDGSGSKVMLPKPPQGGLDGLLKLSDGRYIISSWGGSAIYALNRDNTYTVLMDSVDAPADLGFDSKRNRVLIPLFRENKITFLAL